LRSICSANARIPPDSICFAFASAASRKSGGTDAAFASLNTKAPVLERFGLQGFGAHSNDAEYVAVDSIEPRLYLLARLIMDVSQGRDRN